MYEARGFSLLERLRVARHSLSKPEQAAGLGGAVIASLVLVLFLLGFQYAWSVKRARGQALVTAELVAASLLQDVTSVSEFGGWGILVEALVPTFRLLDDGPATTVAEMERRATLYTTTCQCVPMQPSMYVAADVELAEVATRARVGAAPLSKSEGEEILRLAREGTPDTRRVQAMPFHRGEQSGMLFVRLLEADDGRRSVAAVMVPQDEVVARVFLPALRTVMTSRFPTVPHRDSIIGFSVGYIGEPAFATAGWTGVGPRAENTFWGAKSDALQGAIVVNPAQLPFVVPGGVPELHVPMLALLGALAASAGAAGIVLLHRARQLTMSRVLFLSAVSHDLKTPLTQLILYGELLGGAVPSDADRRRWADVIVREAERLSHMVRNLLHMSTSIGGELPVNLRVGRVNRVVTQLVEDLEPLLARKQVTITVTHESAPVTAFDPEALRQILVNLIDNAVRYGPEGQRIVLTVSDAREEAHLTVEDEGPGIPVHLRRRAIHAFERLRRNEDSGNGLGIGLAISCRLARAMGGRLIIADRPAGGARVGIALPIAPSNLSGAS